NRRRWRLHDRRLCLRAVWLRRGCRLRIGRYRLALRLGISWLRLALSQERRGDEEHSRSCQDSTMNAFECESHRCRGVRIGYSAYGKLLKVETFTGVENSGSGTCFVTRRHYICPWSDTARI